MLTLVHQSLVALRGFVPPLPAVVPGWRLVVGAIPLTPARRLDLLLGLGQRRPERPVGEALNILLLRLQAVPDTHQMVVIPFSAVVRAKPGGKPGAGDGEGTLRVVHCGDDLPPPPAHEGPARRRRARLLVVGNDNQTTVLVVADAGRLGLQEADLLADNALGCADLLHQLRAGSVKVVDEGHEGRDLQVGMPLGSVQGFDLGLDLLPEAGEDEAVQGDVRLQEAGELVDGGVEGPEEEEDGETEGHGREILGGGGGKSRDGGETGGDRQRGGGDELGAGDKKHHEE